MRKFSSGPIQNKVLTITSEHPSSEDHFERNFQGNISSSNQSLEQPEEELIEFKAKQQMGTKIFPSEHIENKMVTLTSETLFSEDCFENKLQGNFDKYDKKIEQPEEELVDFIEKQRQESEHIEEKLVNLN